MANPIEKPISSDVKATGKLLFFVGLHQRGCVKITPPFANPVSVNFAFIELFETELGVATDAVLEHQNCGNERAEISIFEYQSIIVEAMISAYRR